MLRKYLSVMLILAMLFSIISFAGTSIKAHAATAYYVSSSTGDDSWPGTQSQPWRTLTKVSSMTFQPGDTINLKCGDTWSGQELVCNGNGSVSSYITVQSYGTGNKPIITSPSLDTDSDICNGLNQNPDPRTSAQIAIRLKNSYGWSILGLNITNTQYGIVQQDSISGDGYTDVGLVVENCDFSNINGGRLFQNGCNGHSVDNPYPFLQRSSAIIVANKFIHEGDRHNNYTFKNLTVQDADEAIYTDMVGNFLIDNVNTYDMHHVALDIEGNDTGTIQNCTLQHTGYPNGVYHGVTAVFFGASSNITMQNCTINDVYDRYGDGCGVDYEGGNNTNITTQNCTIRNCFRSAFLYCGSWGGNFNCNVYNCTIENCGLAGPTEPCFIRFLPQPGNGGTISGNHINKSYSNQAIVWTNWINDTWPSTGYTISNNDVNFVPTTRWDFNSTGFYEGWYAGNNVSSLTVSGGCLNGIETGRDPNIFSRRNLGIDISNNKIIKIKMKNSSSNTIGKIYFTTTSDTSWNEEKSFPFTTISNDPDYTEYTLNLSSLASWTGTLDWLRLDPQNGADSGSFSIDYIEIVTGPAPTPTPTPTPTPSGSAEYVASTGFSSTQGQNQWYYQEWNGSTYTDMTYNGSRWSGSEPYLVVFSNGQHPGSTKDSVRKWVAPLSGSIRITGNVKKSDTGGGDGVIVSIKKNSMVVWGPATIAYNDTAGVNHDITQAVNAGDAIYFIVNRNGNYSYDSTLWDPTITYLSYQASTGFSSTQGQNQWYYQEWNGSAYTDMTWDSGNIRWKGSYPWTVVAGDSQHPDGTDPVRKWLAPFSGTITITGTVKKMDTRGGDGVIATIKHNTATIWGAQTIAYNDNTGYIHNVTRTVAAGDVIYFIVNKNGNNSYDATSWDPVITYN